MTDAYGLTSCGREHHGTALIATTIQVTRSRTAK